MAQPGDQPSSASSGDDWTIQAADSIERIVTTIRDKTSIPLTTIARGIVYGLLAAVMGLAALTLVTIGMVRFVNIWLPGDVWATHALIGGIFTAVGAFALRKASKRPAKG